MSMIDVSEARQQLSAVIDRAEKEAVTLVRYGRPAAVLLSPARYEELLAAAEGGCREKPAQHRRVIKA